MTRILLDTSAYSHYVRNHAGIVEAVRTAETVVMSPVVLGELRVGFTLGGLSASNEANLRRFLSSPRVQMLTVDDDTSVFYSNIKVSLRRSGVPIPSNDVWIAASAMQHGLQIVTMDAHFDRLNQVMVRRFN